MNYNRTPSESSRKTSSGFSNGRRISEQPTSEKKSTIFGWFSSGQKEEKENHGAEHERAQQAELIHQYWKNYDLNISTEPERMNPKDFDALDKLRTALSKVIVQYRCRKLVESKRKDARVKSAILIQAQVRRYMTKKKYEADLKNKKMELEELKAYTAFKTHLMKQGENVEILTFSGAQQRKVLSVNPKTMDLIWKKKVPGGWKFPLRRLRPNHHKGVFRGFDIPEEMKGRKINWPATSNCVTLTAKEKTVKTEQKVTFVFDEAGDASTFYKNFSKLNEEVNGRSAFQQKNGSCIRKGKSIFEERRKDEDKKEKKSLLETLKGKNPLRRMKKKKGGEETGDDAESKTPPGEERDSRETSVTSSHPTNSEDGAQSKSFIGDPDPEAYDSQLGVEETKEEAHIRQSFSVMAGSVPSREESKISGISGLTNHDDVVKESDVQVSMEESTWNESKSFTETDLTSTFTGTDLTSTITGTDLTSPSTSERGSEFSGSTSGSESESDSGSGSEDESESGTEDEDEDDDEDTGSSSDEETEDGSEETETDEDDSRINSR